MLTRDEGSFPVIGINLTYGLAARFFEPQGRVAASGPGGNQVRCLIPDRQREYQDGEKAAITTLSLQN